jgi:Flp pilus assembly pilin Flp
VFVAGIPVRDEAVLELARLVDDPELAAKLEENYSRGTNVLALTIAERSTILAAFEDPPADLAELRGVLLRELAWLRSEGLASRAPPPQGVAPHLRLDAAASRNTLQIVARGRHASESGQTMAEHAIVLAAIAVVCVLALMLLAVAIRGQVGSAQPPTPGAPLEPPSVGTVAQPSSPTTLAECEHGGWRDFPQFHNEAECKQYVHSLRP